MKKETKYTFACIRDDGTTEVTAVVAGYSKAHAISKLCEELGVKELPVEWRLTKYDIK